VTRLGELAAAVGGSDPGRCTSADVTGVVTDSRLAGPGSLFFALPGERTDGHRFVDRLVGEGAFAVVSEGAPREGVIVVQDVGRALIEAATWRRGRLSSTVVGISGSNGKTTTRMLLCAALGSSFTVCGTTGNHNNRIGLPLTLLNVPVPDPDFVVLEMGMNHAGELAELCRIARPDHCLVTNVGIAHMEFLGSREGIARAKAELPAGTAAGGICVIPTGEPILAAKALEAGLNLHEAGPGGEAWAETGAGSCLLRPWDIRLDLALRGSHHCRNAASALLLAVLLGAGPAAAARAMEEVRPMRGRGRTVAARGLVVLDESYNANPDSMAACLDALAAGEGAKGAVLGDMLELGESSVERHREVLERTRGMGLSFLILVGPVFASLAGGSTSAPTEVAGDWREALALLLAKAPAGCTVLVKGSNALRLGELVLALEGED